MPNTWEPATSAVIIIDVQNSLCHPGGDAAPEGHSLAAIHRMMPRLIQVTRAARHAGALVVHARSAPTHPMADALDWGLEAFSMAPYPTDVSLVRQEGSAFRGTLLDSILQAEGITSLLLAGVTTLGGVAASGRDAEDHGYGVGLLHDCCASHDSGTGIATALGVWRDGVDLISGTDVTGQWSRSVPSMTASRPS